jgi:hypothetical protein
MYLDAGSGSGVSLRGADDPGKSLREHSARRRGSTVGTGHRSKGSVARARAGSRRGSEILPNFGSHGSRRGSEILPRAGSHGSNTMMFGGDRDGPPMVDIVVHSLDQVISLGLTPKFTPFRVFSNLVNPRTKFPHPQTIHPRQYTPSKFTTRKKVS